ncbi:hypothetical protein PoB_003145500 [Plakobranchus ocellatus]|uniref:Uncharacterized protein n=1 Tax=Plakobranchus ocellatus TaxID=259542 RepID=A0AAV4ADV4_9GAST|nr:hypothetical protein PoB_003145500 [Plakobranchus ocellatus]
MFVLGCYDGRMRVYCRRNERFEDQYVDKNANRGYGKVTVWARNHNRPQGSRKWRQLRRNILQPHVAPSLASSITLQEPDRARLEHSQPSHPRDESCPSKQRTLGTPSHKIKVFQHCQFYESQMPDRYCCRRRSHTVLILPNLQPLPDMLNLTRPVQRHVQYKSADELGQLSKVRSNVSSIQFPKNVHSLRRVQSALVSAAAEHNSGPAAISAIKKTLSIQEGYHGHRLGQQRAKKGLYLNSQEQQKKKPKKREKMRAAAQEKARQEKEAEEGGPAYQA